VFGEVNDFDAINIPPLPLKHTTHTPSKYKILVANTKQCHRHETTGHRVKTGHERRPQQWLTDLACKLKYEYSYFYNLSKLHVNGVLLTCWNNNGRNEQKL